MRNSFSPARRHTLFKLRIKECWWSPELTIMALIIKSVNLSICQEMYGWQRHLK